MSTWGQVVGRARAAAAVVVVVERQRRVRWRVAGVGLYSPGCQRRDHHQQQRHEPPAHGSREKSSRLFHITQVLINTLKMLFVISPQI